MLHSTLSISTIILLLLILLHFCDKLISRNLGDSMNKLNIKIDYNNLINEEFQNYLLRLKGILSIINKKENDETITIEYNNDITLYILIKEISLYLDIDNIPSISYFNKHLTSPLEEYIITIEHLCCEYCLYSNIEELLYVEGINEVSTNFDNKSKSNIKIYIKYDKEKISIQELSKFQENFNK